MRRTKRLRVHAAVDREAGGDHPDTVDALNGFPVACVDGDGDGYGSPASPGCAHFDLDCDDTNGSVHPDATEIPGNGLDDDCNTATPGACEGTQSANAAVGGAGRLEGRASAPVDLGLYLVPAAALVLAGRGRRW